MKEMASAGVSTAATKRRTTTMRSSRNTDPGFGGGDCRRRMLSLVVLCSLPLSATALLVRSHGSGGIATGLAYNSEDHQVVVVGSTFSKTFWNMNMENNDETSGECFVAMGDVDTATNTDNPQFSRLAMENQLCFGGTSTLNHQEEGGLGVATLLGVQLNDSQNGFLHSVLYYLGQVSSANAPPTELPEHRLPVVSFLGDDEGGDTYMGLHVLEPDNVPFDESGTEEASLLSPLASLLLYWWGSTFPPNQAIVDPNTKVSLKPLSRKAPHVRKQNVFTGILSYDVSLEQPSTDDTDTGSTALIAGLVVPRDNNAGLLEDDDTTSSGKNKPHPLIVAGSTNGPSSSQSLFGQALSKDPTSTDWDGYILFLDPDTGAVFEYQNENTGSKTVRTPIRINSVGNDDDDSNDDFIQAMCLSSNQRYLYVVGTTTGILSGIHKGGAFVFLIDLKDDDTILWRYQSLPGINVQGLACTADDDAVYLGGSTESDLWENPAAQQPTLSPDAFVTKILRTNGRAQWTQPLDTSRDDHRREMIVDMQTTNTGYVLVLMNSMNLSTGENEVFLLDLDPATGVNDLYTALNDFSIAIPTFGTNTGNSNDSSSEDKDVMIVAIAVPVVLAILLFGFTWWRHRTDVERIPKATQKDNAKKPSEGNELV